MYKFKPLNFIEFNYTYWLFDPTSSLNFNLKFCKIGSEMVFIGSFVSL